MAEYRNELLDELVGRAVIVSRIKPPDFTEEDVAKLRTNPYYSMQGLTASIRTAYVLMGYDDQGLVLRTLDDEQAFFQPWGTVIQVEDGLDAHQDLVG